MDYTESESDANQSKRSSLWNPNVYVPGTYEDDEDYEITKKIETFFGEEDDEEDSQESSLECTEIGSCSGESETAPDGGNQQTEERYQEAEGGDSELEECRPLRTGDEAVIAKEVSGGPFRIEYIEHELIYEESDEEPENDLKYVKKKQVFFQDSSEDEITVVKWKDKNIVSDAADSGVTVIKSRYLTAVPVGLIADNTKQQEPVRDEQPAEKPEIRTFYDEDEDVYVPPEDDSVEEFVGFVPMREPDAGEIPEEEFQDDDLDYNDVFQNDPEILRKRKKKRKVKSVVGYILKEAAILVLIFILSVFLVAAFNVLFRRQNEVFGTSMEPTYVHGDIVYSSYFAYITGEPEIGDIVIFDYTAFEKEKSPTFWVMLGDVIRNNKLTQFISKKESGLDKYWIKRVVGVGGDTIEFKGGQFYRNGEPIYEDYIKDQVVTSYPSDGTTIVVPEGYVFIMGDNRNISHDSRAIGCVPLKYIIGKCK